jgi:hypothetical protein
MIKNNLNYPEFKAELAKNVDKVKGALDESSRDTLYLYIKDEAIPNISIRINRLSAIIMQAVRKRESFRENSYLENLNKKEIESLLNGINKDNDELIILKKEKEELIECRDNLINFNTIDDFLKLPCFI